MSVTYTTAVKTARITATRDYFANGTIEILTAAGAVIATIGLGATGGTISGAVWTLSFDGPAAASLAGTNTATKAQIKTSGGTIGITDTLTVGLAGSGADIILDAVVITAGQSVNITSGTITHP